MKKLRFDLRAVFYKEGSVWICHCLEMDIMGHGKSKLKAFELMQGAINQQVATSFVHGNLSNIFMPADARIFEMYMSGKDTALGKVVIEEIQKGADAATSAIQRLPNVEFQHMHTREVCYA